MSKYSSETDSSRSLHTRGVDGSIPSAPTNLAFRCCRSGTSAGSGSTRSSRASPSTSFRSAGAGTTRSARTRAAGFPYNTVPVFLPRPSGHGGRSGLTTGGHAVPMALNVHLSGDFGDGEVAALRWLSTQLAHMVDDGLLGRQMAAALRPLRARRRHACVPWRHSALYPLTAPNGSRAHGCSR